MAEPPSGAVTFLFSDIEGSTRLVRQLRERWGDVLAEHQQLLRTAFGDHDGYEVDTQGDSFFVAFATPRDGVLAAVQGQSALLARRWPDGVELKVRMGIHTGQAVATGGRYTGLAVHRAARIGAAAHGGQILVSQATQTLLEDDEEELDLSLRDLGEHRLKDLARPVRLYQVVAAGLLEAFPPLRQEAELAQAAEAALAAPRRRRRRIMLAGAAVAVAAAAIGLTFALTGGGAQVRVNPNSLAVIDAGRNKVVYQVGVGTRPQQLTVGNGSVWVANQGDSTVSRINLATRRQVHQISLAAQLTGLAAGRNGIWVSTDKGIKVIDPAYDDVVRTIRIREGRPTAGGPFVPSPIGIAFARNAPWVIDGDFGGHVLRLDPRTGGVVDQKTTGTAPGALAGGGDLWVADSFDNTVTRIDQTGAVTAHIGVGHGPTAIAVGEGAVWVADGQDDDVKRIDPTIPAVQTTIPVGDSPSAIVVGGGAVWVANRDGGTISRIDAKENRVVRTIPIGGSPSGLAYADGSVWVSVQARPAALNEELVKEGGVAQIDGTVVGTDPASQQSFNTISLQLHHATCAGLLNFPDKPPPAGVRPQPEVAKSMAVSPDGETYTFTVRSGFRFSPPSNEPVTAATFKYTIERTLNPKLESPGAVYVNDIVGEDRYVKGKAAHISGIVARGNVLTIRLTHAAGDFPTRVASFFCAVPTNTPMHPIQTPPIPMAGPYYVASHVPGAQTVLKRNPNYRGPRPHRLAEIVYTPSSSTSRAVARIVSGQSDYTPDFLDSQSRVKLEPRYGPGSPAARAGHQQAFIHPDLAVDALALNTSRGLFSDPQLRRAVNYALDRKALAEQGAFGTPGPLTAEPTDQYLPPGLPGFSDVALYPLGGDLRRARQLAGNRKRSAEMYTCDFAPCPQEAQIVKRRLALLGIAVHIKALGLGSLFTRETRANEPFDIGLVTARKDYPDPFDFLDFYFDGSLGPNHSHFDDPVWNRRIEKAARLSGEARYRAYARLDSDLATKAAPWVAFQNQTNFDFFSARIGCQTYQPYFGMDLAALCIRPDQRP